MKIREREDRQEQMKAVVQMPKLRPEMVLVTPQKADEFLAQSRGNRNINQTKVDAYAEDMLRGKFYAYHPLGFDVNKKFFDGHHRMLAIKKAGVSLYFLVLRNVPEETIPYIDQGWMRTIQHVYKAEGVDIKKDILDTAKRIFEGYQGGPSATRDEFMQFLPKHRESIDFTLKQFAKRLRRVSQASVWAVVARAWYSCDKTVLTRFCECLSTGEMNSPEEQPAIRLRDWLLRENRTGASARIEIYKKVSFALDAFIDGRRIQALLMSKEERFPLPD